MKLNFASETQKKFFEAKEEPVTFCGGYGSYRSWAPMPQDVFKFNGLKIDWIVLDESAEWK